MNKSTVIIPVLNQEALTRQCLEAVVGREDCQIVVVDDASTDGTARMLSTFGERITLIRHKRNHGFARSCNDGAAAARTKFLVFLNNDTIPQSGWLQQLENYANEHPRAAVVGSKLLYPTNTIQHAGVVICQDRYPRHIYTGFPSSHAAVNKSRRFQIVTAACMLVRRGVFAEAGGFDDKFRNGFEDVDFCLRLGAKGQEVHYCAESVVHHLESVSPNRFKRDKENVALYRSRWLARVQPDDLTYFIEDGFLQLTYEGSFPLNLKVSPELAVIDSGRKKQLEEDFAQKNRQLRDMTREVTRLRAELGEKNPGSSALAYSRLQQQIRKKVQMATPADCTVLVASKGDGELLRFRQRQGWHFPQADSGVYAGHHPANDDEVVSHLEALRARGAQYLLIPAPTLWWLDHYTGFRKHLERHYQSVLRVPKVCALFHLGGGLRRAM